MNISKNILSFLLFTTLFLISCEKEYSEIYDPAQNVPPVISNLQAPDTLTVSTDTIKITLSVQVSDADGLSNIQSVFFNAFLPSGAPSGGNPFGMFDDGNLLLNGDITAGDGIYSRIIILPPGTTSGSYKFDFQALDKAGEYSNTITHFIVVK